MSSRCFAYEEYMLRGIKHKGCEILNRKAFIQVQRKWGGCSIRNCPFYKEDRDQIRSDIGIYPMSNKQKYDQKRYYDLNYKGMANLLKFD